MERPLVYVAGGIVLPTLSMWLSASLVPEWQTGERADYVAVLFAPALTGLFLPLFAFAATTLLVVVARPETESIVLRLGLLTGVTLSAQYIGVMALAEPGALVPALCVLVPFALSWMLAASGVIGCVGVVMATFVVPAFPMMVLTKGNFHPALYLVFWIGSLLAAAPMFSLVTYGYLLFHAKGVRPGPSRVSVLPWFVVFIGTWRVALSRLDEVYRALPTSPPSGDCYVSTAAANGHSWVVGSWWQQGRVVNRQMLVLKSAERLLRAKVPGVHRRMRSVYDALGPKLARHLSAPLLADVAYVLLKPCEWLGWGLVWCHIINRAYDSSRPAPGSEP